MCLGPLRVVIVLRKMAFYLNLENHFKIAPVGIDDIEMLMAPSAGGKVLQALLNIHK